MMLMRRQKEKMSEIKIQIDQLQAQHLSLIHILAIGVTPDTALAKEAGLELGIKGRIEMCIRDSHSSILFFAVRFWK